MGRAHFRLALPLLLAALQGAALAEEARLPDLLQEGAVAQAQPSATPDPAFLELPEHALEAEPSPGASPAPGSALVGDALRFRVAGFTAPPGAQGALQLAAAPGDKSLTDQGWEISVAEGAAAGELRIEAVPLKPGRQNVPAMIVRDGEGRGVARTRALEVDVASAIPADDPQPQQAAEPRPPVSLGFPWWVIALGALLLAALLAAGIYGLRRLGARKPKPAPARPEAPPRPEDEVALAALDELARRGAIERGEFKAYYFGISEILKAYVGARYRFDASESTTREMIGYLDDKRVLADAQIDRLETLFEKLDLVKFTDHVPDSTEGPRLLEQARELVRSTRRVPQIAPQTGGQP